MCFAGATVDYRDGYVGCMRGLMVNGVEMDLRGKVERGEVTYGVSSGLIIFPILTKMMITAALHNYFRKIS